MMQVCHFHADEGVIGTLTGNPDGSRKFTCPRTKGHPHPGPYTWLVVPEPPQAAAEESLASRYELATELPAAVAACHGRWVEYGVVEHAYATARPDDFAELVSRFGHTAIQPGQYTVSSYLARRLGSLSRTGAVLYHDGPATGRWDYDAGISWWAIDPEPDWSLRLSWADSGLSMDYVPGGHEK